MVGSLHIEAFLQIACELYHPQLAEKGKRKQDDFSRDLNTGILYYTVAHVSLAQFTVSTDLVKIGFFVQVGCFHGRHPAQSKDVSVWVFYS